MPAILTRHAAQHQLDPTLPQLPLSILTRVRLAYLALHRNPYADSDMRDWCDGRSPGVVPRTDRQPRVPPRSFLSARRWACPLCTSLTHSQPGLADGPTRGSLGTCPSRMASTYARSWSIRARS
jgi:hypothetical protein